jgi:hypothetical protein
MTIILNRSASEGSAFIDGKPHKACQKAYQLVRSTEQRCIIFALREYWTTHSCKLLTHLDVYDDEVLIDPNCGSCLKQCLAAYYQSSISLKLLSQSEFSIA